MALGLAQQRSLIERVNELRRINPGLLAAIELAQGFAFPHIEISSPAPAAKPVVRTMLQPSQTTPVVRGNLPFASLYAPAGSETEEPKKKIKKLTSKSARSRWHWPSMTPTIISLEGARARKKIARDMGGGGPAIDEIVAQLEEAIEELHRLTEDNRQRLTEDELERITEGV
jgi:hypothetical protein